jgi:intergrase/recombinase
MMYYAMKYGDCLKQMDLTVLSGLPETIRPNVMKSVGALAKFLGVNDRYKQALKNYGVTWKGKSTDQLVMERFSRIKDPDEVFQWIRQVKEERPELSDFMDFMATTGLRLNEAIASYNLIIELNRKHKLSEYWNGAVLEHYKFKETFLRRSKKAFMSFVPKTLIARIIDNEPLPNYAGVENRLKRRGLKNRFSDIREAHGSYLTKHLKSSEIDFLHGRVSSSVFMSNYFNPSLIGDLKERAFKAIAEIQTKIS